MLSLICWRHWLNNISCHPDSISSTLKSINFSSFSNIKICLRIQGTLPVTTCTCERSFSSIRRLKNYPCSAMVSDRLNWIALMHVHQDAIPDTEKVIDLCAGLNRLLNFTSFFFFLVNFVFLENCIIIMFKFRSSFAREVVDRL